MFPVDQVIKKITIWAPYSFLEPKPQLSILMNKGKVSINMQGEILNPIFRCSAKLCALGVGVGHYPQREI